MNGVWEHIGSCFASQTCILARFTFRYGGTALNRSTNMVQEYAFTRFLFPKLYSGTI